MADMRPLTEAEIENALSFINSSSRDVWVKMAFAIKTELGDSGFKIWDDWSRNSPDYNERAAKQTWKSAKVGGKVGIATLIFEAQSCGWNLQNPEIQTLSIEEISKREKEKKDFHAREKREAAKRAKLAKEIANSAWDAAKPCNVYGYLTRKRIQSHGLRVGDWPMQNAETGQWGRFHPNTLIVPMKNETGEITSLQAIWDEKPRGYRTSKGYLTDGIKTGSWHTIGTIQGADSVILTEGYATGATLYEVTGFPVLVCFDRANLVSVAKKVSSVLRGSNIIVCADNDCETKDNPGLSDGRKAAKAANGKCIFPAFTDEEISRWKEETGSNKPPSDFNDMLFIRGENAIRDAIEGKEDKKPEKDDYGLTREARPFYPLGYNRGDYYYLGAGTQQITSLSASGHTKTNLLQLAPLSWWAKNYPDERGPSWDAAIDEMMRDCQKAGIFSSNRVRGRGAWTDEGRAVYHFGSHLSVDGVHIDPSDFNTKFVYELDATLPPVSDSPLTDRQGAEILKVASRFSWRKPTSAPLLVGFLALAPICGALHWRPHVWLTGAAGTGKSTVLSEFVHPFMNGCAIFAQGNTTEAGLRQTLRSDALPVLFDETEQNNDREVARMQNVLSLIRQSSTESAATTLKGTAHGEAMRFLIRSMFCLSSIQVGIQSKADADRLTLLDLVKPPADEKSRKDFSTLQSNLYEMAKAKWPSRLMARSLMNLSSILANIEVFCGVGAEKFGSSREGDQFGTLMAGCWSCINAGIATPSQARAMLDGYDWKDLQDNTSANESHLVLDAILQSELSSGTGPVSVSEAIGSASGKRAGPVVLLKEEAENMLARAGIRIIGNEIWISQSSTKVSDFLKKTHFATDWKGQLLRIEGARKADKTVRINQITSRCIIVPLSYLMD